jgi:hypothetical protein
MRTLVEPISTTATSREGFAVGEVVELDAVTEDMAIR